MEIKDKQESKSLYNMSQMDDIDNYYYWAQESDYYRLHQFLFALELPIFKPLIAKLICHVG